jgi:large subunit ribosomal protein L10
VKGGLLDGKLVSAGDLAALADLPPREILLARVAGAISAPLSQLASLLEALPRNLAYGLSALADKRREAGGADADGAPVEPDAPAEA